jgi:hypothetical protein
MPWPASHLAIRPSDSCHYTLRPFTNAIEMLCLWPRQHTSQGHIRRPGSGQLFDSTRGSIVLYERRENLEIARHVGQW